MKIINIKVIAIFVILISSLLIIVKKRNIYLLSDLKYSTLSYENLPDSIKNIYTSYNNSSLYARFEYDDFIILNTESNINVQYFTNTTFTKDWNIIDYLRYGNTRNLKYMNNRIILNDIKSPSIYFNRKIYVPCCDKENNVNLDYKKMIYKRYVLENL